MAAPTRGRGTFQGRRSRLTGAFAAALLAVLVAGPAGLPPGATTAAAASMGPVFYASVTPQRTSPRPLANGSTVRGRVYVFLRLPSTVARVTFTLDGRTLHADPLPPFDLIRGANERAATAARPWITTSTTNGPHAIGASIRYRDGVTVSASVTVKVANPSPPPCGGSLQALIDRAAAGSTLDLPPCTYREAVTIGKPLTLVGHGTVIAGSDIWAGWRASGAVWISSLRVPDLPTNGNCAPSSPRCAWPEQVFVDGRALPEAAPQSTPRPGTFALDPARHVVLGADPAGHVVEVTTRTAWVRVTASDVTLTGLVLRHVADAPQAGGIAVAGASRFTLSDATLSDSHGALLDIVGGTGHRISDVTLIRGGQEGFHLVGVADTQLVDSRISANNTEGFDPAWEAGGGKVVRSSGVTFARDEVDGNTGPGIWFDIDDTGATVTACRVHDNAKEGILFEIGQGAQISANAVWNNGWSGYAWGYGAGILVSSAGGVAVAGNTVAWNARGIVVISQDRGHGRFPWLARDDTVTGNVIAGTDDPADPNARWALAFAQDWAGGMFDPASGNRGSANLFWYAGPEGPTRFGGWNAWNSLAFWNTTPGGGGTSRYLSAAELAPRLAAAGIPGSPPPHG